MWCVVSRRADLQRTKAIVKLEDSLCIEKSWVASGRADWQIDSWRGATTSFVHLAAHCPSPRVCIASLLVEELNLAMAAELEMQTSSTQKQVKRRTHKKRIFWYFQAWPESDRAWSGLLMLDRDLIETWSAVLIGLDRNLLANMLATRHNLITSWSQVNQHR